MTPLRSDGWPMAWPSWVAAPVLMLVLGGSAVAEAAPPGPTPSSTRDGQRGLTEGVEAPRAVPRSARSRGTHFFLEGSLGFGLSESLSYQGAATLGAGGRWPGTPVRGYLVLTGAMQRARRDAFGARRRRFDVFVGVGPRLYVGLVPGLRLYGELVVGAQRASDTVRPAVGRSLHEAGVRAELRSGLGFQVRPIEALSFGFGVTYRAFDDAYAQVAASEGLTPLTPWIGHGTATFHF